MSAKKLRVLLVSPVGDHGGAEQVFLSLAKYLPQCGIDPILACLRPGPLADIAHKQGLKTHVFREHRFRQFSMVGKGVAWLMQVIRTEKIDLLHSNHAAHLYSGLAGKLAGKPELWHIHDFPYQRDSLDRLISRLPKSYVLFTTRRVESGYPQFHSDRHSVVHPICVEPERLRAIRSRSDIRRHYDLPAGPLFVTVARLQAHKGHTHLIAAVPAILATCPQATFVLIGRAKGPEQEAYQQQLIADCKRLGVMDNVRFLGYVSEDDLIGLYREALALVHPALSEGFGLTLLEAMAIGTPVIAAAADGPKEIITDEKNGLLIPCGDSSALAQAVIRLLKDPILAQTLREQASIYVDAVSVENMATQTADIYRKIC